MSSPIMSQLDANQITRTIYDPSTGASRNVPTYVDTTVWVNVHTGGTTFTSSAINILPFKVTGVMINWVGFNQSDATVQFQGSVDGVIYENIGSAVATTAGTSQKGVSFIDEPYKYIQAVFTHGTNTAGVISLTYVQRA
jgi:hypothetical protein